MLIGARTGIGAYGQVLCSNRPTTNLPDCNLVRQVLLNCVRPTHETLFADVPNLSIENATKMSKDRKLWSSNRP